MNKIAETIITALGYSNSPNFLVHTEFNNAGTSKFILTQASDKMGVAGAFGRWEKGLTEKGTRKFIPLLYVVLANNKEDAREFHRKIWTQGAVPLILFITPSTIYYNIGFEFSYQNWAPEKNKIPTDDIESHISSIEFFKAARLSSQISLRDFTINHGSRVDKRLLLALQGLRSHLAKLELNSPQTINLLIGRFLYFYVLFDRGLLPKEWLEQYIDPDYFRTRTEKLTVNACWQLFDAIDDLLNGSIFPISHEARETIQDKHVQALRNCLKLGDSYTVYAQQLSFIDFDLSSIQTETLSAIYEQFIDLEKQNEDSSKRQDGAYYTPPYLVDFAIDRVQEEYPITENIKILDSTAGSGVFLVSLYRRLIERELEISSAISARRLAEILSTSLFAIEKNASAGAVCAFSLYLTLLDYVSECDVKEYFLQRKEDKLFPPLLGKNIIVSDLFEFTFNNTANNWPEKFNIIVGNPPWQKLDAITTNHSLVEDKFSTQIDTNEASEAIALYLLDNFISNDGIIGLVMPTKSLIGPSAKKFPKALFSQSSVVGIANFSHLRYKLFEDARQAASVVLFKSGAPRRQHKIWTYSPYRANLIADKKGDPWFISVDKSRVEHVRQAEILSLESGLFNQLMLRPIDRYISRYLRDQIDIGRFVNLSTFLNRNGFVIARGGSPKQTNLPSEKLLGADKNKDNNFRYAPGVELLEKGAQGELEVSAKFKKYQINSGELEKVPSTMRLLFSGNVLLIPRSLQGIAYASKPIAFGSSINAIAFNEHGNLERDQEKIKKALRTIGRYLSSDIAKYFYALIGKLWILDRTRLEKSDLLEIPIPFSSLDDEIIDTLSNCTDEYFNKVVFEKFSLDGWLNDNITEYGKFRSGFEDGQLAADFSMPADESIEKYIVALESIIKGTFPNAKVTNSSGSRERITINMALDTNKSHPLDSPKGNKSNTTIQDDEIIDFDQKFWFGSVIKPNEKFRWTTEAAFSDAAQIMKRLMA